MATPAPRKKHRFSCPWPGCESSYDRRGRLEHHYTHFHIRTSNLRYELPPLARARSHSRLRAISPITFKSKAKSTQLVLPAAGERSRQRLHKTHGGEGRKRKTSIIDLRSVSLSPDSDEQNQPIVIDTDTDQDEIPNQVALIGKFLPSRSPDTRISNPEEEIQSQVGVSSQPSTMNLNGPRWAVDNDVPPFPLRSTENTADDLAGHVDMDADEMELDYHHDLESRKSSNLIVKAGGALQKFDEQEGDDQCVEDDADDEITLAGLEEGTFHQEIPSREERKINADQNNYNQANETDELATDTDEEEAIPIPCTPIASRQTSISLDGFDDISPFVTLSERAPKLLPVTPCPTAIPGATDVKASPNLSSEQEWNSLDPFIAGAEESLRTTLPRIIHGQALAAEESPFPSQIGQVSTPPGDGDSQEQLFRTPTWSFRNQSTLSPPSSITAASLLLMTPNPTGNSDSYSLSVFPAVPSSPTPMPKTFLQSNESFCSERTDQEFKSEETLQIDFVEAYRLIKELKGVTKALASGKGNGKDEQRAKETFYALCEIWALRGRHG